MIALFVCVIMGMLLFFAFLIFFNKADDIHSTERENYRRKQMEELRKENERR